MKLHIWFLCFSGLFIAQSVAAVEVDGLFKAQVSVSSQSREDRNKALGEALQIVISRLTTGNEFTQNPAVKSALENAATYVDQYQYAQTARVTGAKSPAILRVSFNQDAIMAFMCHSGLAVWGGNRDKTLLWLVIEQRGKQAFLDVEQNVEIVSELQQAFQANSMPLLLPLMDLEEKQAISVKELLAPDAEKVLAVSARYDVATILTGKLVKQRTCWRSEWALHLDNKVERWSNACADLKTSLELAMQRVYQHLSTYYAGLACH
jgi:hypothetical protein